jgi:hypothetical protein
LAPRRHSAKPSSGDATSETERCSRPTSSFKWDVALHTGPTNSRRSSPISPPPPLSIATGPIGECRGPGLCWPPATSRDRGGFLGPTITKERRGPAARRRPYSPRSRSWLPLSSKTQLFSGNSSRAVLGDEDLAVERGRCANSRWQHPTERIYVVACWTHPAVQKAVAQPRRSVQQNFLLLLA